MQYDALDIETQAGTRKKPMALELTILVGTMTGTAQLVAQELELTLDDGEMRVRTAIMDGLDAGVFSGGGLFLICSSTYGRGDVPDNAKNLYEALRRDPLRAGSEAHRRGHAARRKRWHHARGSRGGVGGRLDLAVSQRCPTHRLS